VSHYSTISTRFASADALVKALADMGFAEVEVHSTPQPLEGFMGMARRQRAELIIRRRHLDTASNDIGFARGPDGCFEAIVSDFDMRKYGLPWLQKLSQRYAYHAVREALGAQNFELVSEEIEKEGAVRMVLRRMA
jgi:hypothetical protein